jgi:hypothetical protein
VPRGTILPPSHILKLSLIIQSAGVRLGSYHPLAVAMNGDNQSYLWPSQTLGQAELTQRVLELEGWSPYSLIRSLNQRAAISGRRGAETLVEAGMLMEIL